MELAVATILGTPSLPRDSAALLWEDQGSLIIKL